VTSIEVIAAILIVVNVALVARRSVWNYPFGIVGVALYAAVFRDARLYSDMALQGVFFSLNIYGWTTWARARAAAGEVRVEMLTASARWAWAFACAAATIIWGTVMATYTDAARPWWDAGIAVTSVAAQYLLARRKLENWVLWIGVDVAAIGLYASRGLWPTTLLYVGLLGLAIWGCRDWRRNMRSVEPGQVALA
jgi:nicotinamide mononucleotide transporter